MATHRGISALTRIPFHRSASAAAASVQWCVIGPPSRNCARKHQRRRKQRRTHTKDIVEPNNYQFPSSDEEDQVWGGIALSVGVKESTGVYQDRFSRIVVDSIEIRVFFEILVICSRNPICVTKSWEYAPIEWQIRTAESRRQNKQ